MQRLNGEWVQKVLPRREKNSHKGSFGRVLLLCGSTRYRGAALLSADGALRAGAGLVQLASTEAVCAAAAVRLPCCTLLPLAETPDGGIDPKALPQVLAQPEGVLLAGCGLGNTKTTALLLEAVLEKAARPLVLDADALNVLAGHLESGPSPVLAARLLRALDAFEHPLVLTPHVGEMARLCGQTPQQVQRDQAGVAQAYARQHRCVVVLKSHVTVIAGPEGVLYQNDEAGNPGMAKGGSGDVLAGIIAALLAQGLAAEHAAAAGVWLHASAGDALAGEMGEMALSPAQLPQALGKVLKGLGR